MIFESQLFYFGQNTIQRASKTRPYSGSRVEGFYYSFCLHCLGELTEYRGLLVTTPPPPFFEKANELAVN